ncbi:MAG TPA: hypothetical protein VII96_11400 [Acidimicrobiales bacterium]
MAAKSPNDISGHGNRPASCLSLRFLDDGRSFVAKATSERDGDGSIFKVDVSSAQAQDFPSAKLAPRSKVDDDTQVVWHGHGQCFDFGNTGDWSLR